MKRILKKGFHSFQIMEVYEVKSHHKLKKFRDKASALNFLYGFYNDHLNMITLRNMLRDSMSCINISRLDNFMILKQIAFRLASNQYKIAELPFILPAWSDIITEMEKELTTTVATTTSEDIAWIKFMVIDDETGNPISGINLKVKLPDGSQKDLSTKEDGFIEINGIEPGNCEVTCDIKSAKLSDTLSFVGMGMLSSGKVIEDEDSEEPIKESLIAMIEEHKVKTGETPESLASTVEMTWEEFAEFNWGTSDPEEINKHLFYDVGCTKKSTDGKGYVFDDSDDPGIIYVPSQWKKEGLTTNKTHTIRVNTVRPLDAEEEYIFSI